MATKVAKEKKTTEKISKKTETVSKLDPTKVQVGHLMALTFWVKVNGAWNGGQHLNVHDLDNKNDFDVHGKELVANSFSADVYEKEEKVTKTALAEKVVASRHIPMTIEFIKADGSLRVMRCKLLEPEVLMGRSLVYDFDVTEGSPLKQVDHRTLQSVITENVKYVLKS